MTQRLTIEEYKAFIKKPKRPNTTNRGDKAKANMGWVMIDIARRLGLTTVTEYRFNPDRRWKADWALFGTHNGKEVKILVEYEGLGFYKTGHTSSDGYTKNCEKYNNAQALGWTVLRFTYQNYEDLSAELRKLLKP